LFSFSSRRRHTTFSRDWSSDVCSSDLCPGAELADPLEAATGGARLGGRPFPVLCGGCDPGIERSSPVPVLVPRPASPPPCRPRPSRPELPPRRVLSTGHRLPEGFRLGDDEARPFAVDGQLDAF